jgi:hypothetical protein
MNQTTDNPMIDGAVLKLEFQRLIERAFTVSADVGQEVERIIQLGTSTPLSMEELASLIEKALMTMRTAAEVRRDTATLRALGDDPVATAREIVNRARGSAAAVGAERSQALQTYNGIQPHPVKPAPIFHQRPVPVVEGYMRTADIDLWGDNARLDIHLAQFRKEHRREPNSKELLDIMLSKMQLPGVKPGDQFEIDVLARSIAVNGVRKSPILDVDGTLLDGNRRVAACYYILNGDFTPAEKKRVEWLLVWQLTEHATDEDRESVIVSLNFEPDHKQDWPEYVRARKIYEDWSAALAREPRAGASRQQDIRRAISKKFAIDTEKVTRYIKMVELADEFEQYHVVDKRREQFEVKHRAERYFQYFDELSKGGARSGGVLYALNQDDSFKHLVYDLLFDGKFSNWNKIRPLKYIAESPEARDHLQKASAEANVEVAQDLVDEAIGIVQTKRAELRQIGANERIEKFVAFLEDLPVKAFRDSIKPENLLRLHKALKLVEPHLPGAAQDQ